jgi:hypothetical protein
MSMVANVVQTTKKLLTALASQNAEVGRSVDELRDQIAKKRCERDNLLKQPVCKSEAVERLHAAVDACAVTAGIEDLMHQITSARPINILNGFDHERVKWLLANVARKLLVTEVERFYGANPGLTANDRSERLAAIDADLRSLEMAEEALTRTAELAGVRILRRADMSPTVALLPDSELPI